MIRFAERRDFPEICSIWKTCFPEDGESYAGFFLQHCFSQEKCLLWEEQGHTAAMLHLLPQSITFKGVEYKAQYIYAAATLPEYRERGMMAGLIARAEKYAAGSGCSFLTLLPQTEKLYAFYGRMGFQTAFYFSRICAGRAGLVRFAGGEKPLGREDFRIAAVPGIRRAVFPDSAFFNRRLTGFAVRDWFSDGGTALFFGSGYIFCIQEGGTLLVKEWCVPEKEERKAMAALLCQFGCDAFEFHCYPSVHRMGSGALKEAGMLKAVGREGGAVCENMVRERIYMNMALD